MAKKSKKGPLLHRAQERRIGICRRFDLTVAGITLLFLAAALICNGRSYELGLPETSGYLYWLLLVPAYIPLEALGLLSMLLRIETESFTGSEALILGGCDIAMTVAIWLYVRLTSKKRNLEFLSIAWHFAMIFLCWGVLQFSLLGVSMLWEHGGLSRSFHPHLHRPAAPEPVTIVNESAAPIIAE